MALIHCENYTFLDLNDAVACLGQKVSLFAVVIEVGRPTKSKGTDYVCILKIVDESYRTPGISVNFFAQDKAKLPYVMAAGDIIRLDDVEIKIHNKEVFAFFNKKFSSFALFEGKLGECFMPYQAFSQFYSTDHDKTFIGKLRSWWSDYQFDAGANEYVLQLRDIKEGSCVDLICKVIHINEVSEVESILFLWDGTDTPPAPASTQMNEDLEAEKPLPLQLEPSSLPRDVLCTFPTVGSVLRVIAEKDFKELLVQSQSKGQWVKFRNIICQLQSGLWKGTMMPSSRICLLSNKDNTVINRESYYSQRLSAPSERMPISSFPWPSRITETDFDHVKFSTLMDVLTHSKVVHRFKCVVRVVETYPWLVENFRSSIGEHKYRIKLTLEDPTARIHAYLYAEDAVKFFNGYPPTDILASKMRKLLGITESNVEGHNVAATFRNAPWVQCCIKSYYLNESNVWDSRRYRIFGTTLIG